jgi:cyclic-di-AMP phosphodiesterase PgpH
VLPTERLREAAGRLSGEPETGWRGRALHHGARIVLVLILAVGIYLLFPLSPVQDFPAYEKGMVPDQDVIAQFDFPIYKSEAELQHERDEAAAAVAPVFHHDATAVDTMLARVRTFIAYVDSAVGAGGTDLALRNRMRDLLSSYNLPADEDAIALLRSPQNRQLLSRWLEQTIRSELPGGVASSTDLEDSRAQQLRIVRDGREQIVDRDSVIAQQRFFTLAARHMPWNAPSGLADFQHVVLVRLFAPSLRLDRAATEAARDRARQAVPIVKGEVLRGERVIAAHEQIRDLDMERLQAYHNFLAAQGALESGASRMPRVVGAFALNLVLLTVFALHLLLYRPEVYRDFRHVLLLAVLIGGVAAAASVIAANGAPAELVPIAFPALVVAMLWDGRLALNLALVLAILIGAQTPFLAFTPGMVMIIGGAAAALSVRVVRRRAQGLILGAVIAGAYAVASISLGLIRSREVDEVVMSILWGSVNGIGSALLAFGFLPLFESWTRITTDQTLLELADLNRPVLKRLSLEAGGSYAHSINVANLAEAAARAINANALLARVGSYYHDIGKMATPQYFVENQARGRNPHDQLDPAMSAAIVRSHVVEGLRLADQAKLPDSVKVFIPEHHGTQQIVFFLDKAKRLSPDGVDPSEYCYSGPKPQSKETAIVMLADSVESAAKALQDPTPDRVRSLVDRIVDGKIAHGQLDETPLTLRELTAIKDQFVAVLNGMYHHRIDYPPAPPPAGHAAVPSGEPHATSVAPRTG